MSYAPCLHGDDVPPAHDHRFFFRRDNTTDKPLEAVVWAVWQGGFAEILTWPWDADGLAEARAWCDRYGAIWKHDHYPVLPGELAVHVGAP